MLKTKLSTLLVMAIATNLLAPSYLSFAETFNGTEEVALTTSAMSEVGIVNNEAVISKSTLINHPNYEQYKGEFKVDSTKIQVSANKPSFSGTTLEYMMDEDINTYWAPSTRDSDTSKTEVEYIFDEAVDLNRIIYTATQKMPADNCGFPEALEIYGASTEGAEYQLIAQTSGYKSTKETVEIKFETTKFKKLKLKFKEVSGKSKWAYIAEIEFLKEDPLLEKMEELFTDNTKTVVNEKYGSIEKLNELEALVEEHPFYEEFKDKIWDAKVLVSNVAMEPIIAETSIFNHGENTEYNEQFRMDKNNIKSIKNNAGHYSSRVITNAIDGNLLTYWETNKANSVTWNNEVELELKERDTIDKIVLGTRSDGKGFPQNFKIYGSNTSEGDTYNLLTEGSHGKTNNLIEINFNPRELKRIKFVFEKSNQNWATINEIWFYKEDTVSREVKSIFEDNLQSVLSLNYDTVEEITALEERVNGHPLRDTLIETVDRAKALINGNTIEKSEVITLSQRGDENLQKSERRRVFAGGNLDVTGYYVMPEETIEVYVDANKGDILPQIVFAQVGEIDNNSKGNYRTSLKVGKNIVKAPAGAKGYAVYFANKALPSQQEYAPKVRLEGENLNKYPVYVHGKTDPSEYIEQVKNHTGANMTDVAGERFLISAQNTEAKIAYIDNGKSPLDVATSMEELIATFDIIGGYDVKDENPLHRPSQALYHLKMTNGSGLFASNEYTHLGASAARTILAGGVYGWGNLHEFGHQVESSDMRLLEVTNNIYSIMGQAMTGYPIRNLTSNQNKVDSYFTFEGTKGFGGFGEEYDLTFGLFERLLVVMQPIIHFGIESYGTANRLVRENPSRYATGNYQALISALSEAIGYDLVPHFEYYNYPITEETKAFTSQFKPLEKKIRYITMDSYGMEQDKVQLFNGETKAVIKDIKTNEDGFTLSIGTSDDNKGTIAYEIYRDGEFVGFTRNNTYKNLVDVNGTYNYEVIAYDYKANESIKSDVVTSAIGFTPVLKVEDNVTIKLGEGFEPLSYVKAETYNGQSIDVNNVEVIENTVNNGQKGTYTVKYQVQDRKRTATKVLQVKVVSDYTYASDLPWVSATTGWKEVNKDKAVGSNNKIKLKVNGEIKEFEKGIGVATNSEIVYNLEGKGYDYFTTYLGTDKNYNDNRTTIDFIILADGKEVYRSSTITKDSEAEFVEVDLTGVKELKLIANDADGNLLGDFSSWGDSKFITNNSIPTLQVEEGLISKVGEPLGDIIGNYSSIDIEDGDITNKVIVDAPKEININKPGKYKVIYTVTDSDGNKVVKERIISIIDMRDYKDLTDYQWKSAVQSYGTTKKDTNLNGGTIKLTGEQGEEVVYDRGIGAHANATTTYDLTDKNYEYFTAFVGVDRVMYGRVSSLSFEVHVNGVKAFDSGIMYSTDQQKYVEVDIRGAKELKLVVKDGGNGNGSDHGSWGGTKLHYVNEEREDLTQAVEIEDEGLKADIKTVLNIEGDTITLGDMYNLTDLTCSSGYVTSLKGLEYAKNLESLNIDYNEVLDLSPLKNLKNLKNFTAQENFKLKNATTNLEGDYVLEELVIDIDGEVLIPSEVVINPRGDAEVINLEGILDGSKVVLNGDIINKCKAIEVLYESKTTNYKAYVMYLLS